MQADLEIDAVGLLCPLPVLKLRKRISSLPSGSLVKITTDDPAAVIDIPHFCSENGHKFLKSKFKQEIAASQNIHEHFIKVI